MHQFAYTEILEESGSEARRKERDAFDRVNMMLRAAQRSKPGSVQCVEAVFRLRQLWTVLTDDLASIDNGLPDALKASLISIGIWMMKQADEISQGNHDGFDTIIAINTMIRDGLR